MARSPGGPLPAVASCLVGAGLLLLAAGQPWVTAVIHSPSGIPGQFVVSHDVVSGRELSGVAGGLGLLGAAGAIAVFATRGVGRLVLGVVLAAAGLVAAVSSVHVGLSPDAGARLATQAQGFLPGRLTYQGSAWPWVSAVGGLAMAAAGALVARHGRAWAGLSGRFERDQRRVSVPDPERAMWDALDRGEDPT